MIAVTSSFVRCGIRPLTTRRIVGGLEAKRNSWPWQCSLQFNEQVHICGCSIATDRWIITAAHCKYVCVSNSNPGHNATGQNATGKSRLQNTTGKMPQRQKQPWTKCHCLIFAILSGCHFSVWHFVRWYFVRGILSGNPLTLPLCPSTP